MNVMRSAMASLMMAMLLTGTFASAADDMEQLIEKARAEAAEIEKMKKALNEEPDPNVRLAAFNLMTRQGNGTMYEVAVDAGLASADRLLQAAAFKSAVMALDRLHLTLQVDENAADAIQKASRDYLDRKGDQYIIPLNNKDTDAGTFKSGGWSGEVTGTQLSFVYGKQSGTLSLKDDDAVSGKIEFPEGRQQLSYIATGKIR